MSTFFWLFIATALTVLGDYLIKLATLSPNGMRSIQFAFGTLCYGAPAVAWFSLMQKHSLAAVAVFYSSATLVILAALGVLVFKEAFGWRDAAGVVLALAAVSIMQGGE